MTETSEVTPTVKRTRKTPRYLVFTPGIADRDEKGTMRILEGAPQSPRMAEIDKYLVKEAENMLNTLGLDEMVVYVFTEPVKKTIKRETKVTVK